MQIVLPGYRGLRDQLLIILNQTARLLLSFLQVLQLTFLALLKLIMHLLNALIDYVEVFAEPTKRVCRVLLEFITELIEIDVHTFVGKTDLVEHTKERKQLGFSTGMT